MTELEKLREENAELKRLVSAQKKYRADSEKALLEEIAHSLNAEYGDFIETIDMPMCEMLGKIYREKCKQIFKILEKKGLIFEV